MVSAYTKIDSLLAENVFFHPSFGSLNSINELRYLVISDPKTGSTTLSNSLQYAIDEKRKKTNVIHMHSNDSCLFRLFPSLKRYDIGIQEFVKYRNQNNPTKLVVATLYREPIGRGISHFFENIEQTLDLKKEQIERLSINALCDLFLNRCIGFFLTRHIHWQLSKYFGIDIFNTDYSKEKGIGFHESEDYKLIIVRLDRLNSNEKEIARYIQNDKFKIIESNHSDHRWYSNLYKKFKAHLKLPKYLIDQVLWVEEPYINYFYSVKEKEKLHKTIYEQYGYKYLPQEISQSSIPLDRNDVYDNEDYIRRRRFLRL